MSSNETRQEERGERKSELIFVLHCSGRRRVDSGGKFYAVGVGRKIGVFETW